MVNYRWNIFWAGLDPIKGSEQSGIRPVIVISADEVNISLPVVAVLPLTSAKPGRKVYPTEAFLSAAQTGLPQDSLAMAHQLRTISKNRLTGKCGEIKDLTLQHEIIRATKTYLGIA